MGQESKMKIKDCVLIESFKINQNQSVVEVAKKLQQINLRHIFVVDDNEYPVGIISVIDINNRVVAKNLDPITLKAKDIMTTTINVADTQDDIEEFSKKMVSDGHVMEPVVQDKKMIGILTLNELLKKLD